jgi:hypothetical protein
VVAFRQRRDARGEPDERGVGERRDVLPHRIPLETAS